MANLPTIIIADNVVKVPFVLEFKVFSVLLRLFDCGKDNSCHWFMVLIGYSIPIVIPLYSMFEGHCRVTERCAR
jgi:hypothetical protein